MKKLHPRCAALWQAPASWERKNYSIICKSIHQNYSSLQKAQYKRTLSFTTLNYGKHISWGFPNLLFLEVLNLFWGVQLFVLLRFVWNSLPSFIPNDLFLSLLFSALPFHPSLMSNLNDLKGKYQSPRLIPHGVYKDDGWGSSSRVLHRDDVGTQFLLLFTPHPWNELSLLDPRISTLLASTELLAMLFPFFQLCFKSNRIQRFEKLWKKNTFHLILCLQECMPRFTFELLPTLPNSIVPFVSISYIWIFFPFPLVGSVSRMEETSTQALRTAPAIIWHLFLKCLKRCLTEFFPFKLASYMSVEISGSFSH